LRLLQAGKHVLIEKPLAATFEGAQILVDAAEHSGLVLAVGHVFAYHPAVKAMVREISNGTIGEILYTQSQRMNLGPPDPRVDVVWDLAVHDLSIMLAITEQEPVTVQAIGGQFTHANLTDVAFITTRFTNGRLAAHQVGWHASVKVRDFYVAGDAGSMRFDDTLDKDKLKIYDLGIDNRVGPNADQTVDLTYGAGQIRGIFLDEVEPLKQQCEEFVRAISGGPPPTADGRAGLAVVKMLEAATQSIKSNGRLVTLANGDSQKREEG
jgi:predicted dehydrogenase